MYTQIITCYGNCILYNEFLLIFHINVILLLNIYCFLQTLYLFRNQRFPCELVFCNEFV